jgi:predicted esterase
MSQLVTPLPSRAARWSCGALCAASLWLGAPSARGEVPEAPPASAHGSEDASGAAATRWCADELVDLGDGTCVFEGEPPAGEPRTLVIFLHGVIKPDTTWQWAQQRGIVRHAKRFGFTAVMPRGRRGLGPKDMEDWWTWPTSAKKQEAVEADVLATWDASRKLLEAKGGARFERVYVAGFSNGAYYASSLALRGRLDVDGYAIFAGGSAPKYLKSAAARVKTRPPVFVGYGTKDAAGRDAKKLADALRALGWKSRVMPRDVGHTITDSQFEAAWKFLGGG